MKNGFITLGQAATKLNITHFDIQNVLSKSGYEPLSDPRTKLSSSQFNALIMEFSSPVQKTLKRPNPLSGLGVVLPNTIGYDDDGSVHYGYTFDIPDDLNKLLKLRAFTVSGFPFSAGLSSATLEISPFRLSPCWASAWAILSAVLSLSFSCVAF